MERHRKSIFSRQPISAARATKHHNIREGAREASLRMNKGFATWMATALAALFLLNPGKLDAQFTIHRLASGIQDPFGVGAGANGSVYAGTTAAVRKVWQVNSGTALLIGGGGNAFNCPNTVPSTPLGAELEDVQGIAVDNLGKVYVSQTGGTSYFTYSGGILACPPGMPYGIYSANGVAVDNAGNVYFSTTVAQPQIYKVTPTGGVFQLAVGSFSNGCQPGIIGNPQGLAVDSAGTLYIADIQCQVIWSLGGEILRPSNPPIVVVPTVFAGTLNKSSGPWGDGGPATQAVLGGPYGVAVDAYDNVYIADTLHGAIREVMKNGNTYGNIYTIAGYNGSGSPPPGGGCANASGSDNVPATTALVGLPRGIAVGPWGIYFSDAEAEAICQLTEPLPGPTISLTITPTYVPWGGSATVSVTAEGFAWAAQNFQLNVTGRQVSPPDPCRNTLAGYYCPPPAFAPPPQTLTLYPGQPKPLSFPFPVGPRPLGNTTSSYTFDFIATLSSESGTVLASATASMVVE